MDYFWSAPSSYEGVESQRLPSWLRNVPLPLGLFRQAVWFNVRFLVGDELYFPLRGGLS